MRFEAECYEVGISRSESKVNGGKVFDEKDDKIFFMLTSFLQNILCIWSYHICRGVYDGRNGFRPISKGIFEYIG